MWLCTLMAQIRAHASSVASGPPATMIPALEKNSATGPRASALATSARTSASLETSACTAMARCPPASISAATVAAPRPSMSHTTTPAAPRSASPRLRARPTPLAPPVTTATLPVMSMMSASRGGADGRVGPCRELRVGLDEGCELLPRLVSLGRDVLSRPQPGMGFIALQHITGHRHLVHLVDAVRYTHGRRARVHGLQRGQVRGAERAHNVQRPVAHLAQHLRHGVLARRDLSPGCLRA